MKIAICDNEATSISTLKNILKQSSLAENFKIIPYSSGLRLLEDIRSGKTIDIFFLDIDMPEISGIALGKEIKKINPSAIIIFATSYPQYVSDAFDQEAFHYIMKPFDQNKVLTVAERAYQKCLKNQKYHLIKNQNITRRIEISKLYAVEYRQKRVIYYTEKETLEEHTTLGSVYEQLKDYGFIQTNQGYLVNMDKIDRFSNFDVILTNGQRVAISVRRKAEVVSKYAKFIRGEYV